MRFSLEGRLRLSDWLPDLDPDGPVGVELQVHRGGAHGTGPQAFEREFDRLIRLKLRGIQAPPDLANIVSALIASELSAAG